jgi:RNA polymerase sigma factor (sigma-70 family)
VVRRPAQSPEDPAAWERLAADLAAPADVVTDRLTAAECLDALSQEHRQILQLRFREGLAHEQIAARLSISPGNARVRLSRALNAAKALAGEDRR